MDEIIERLDRIERALSAQAAYLDTKQVSELMGISTVTLERWRVDGAGPPYVKLGRLVKYRRADLDEFMERHTVGTSDKKLFHDD